MPALADAERREHDSLIVGQRLRCPRCHGLADILSYFVFDIPEGYEDELNLVLKCRAKVRNKHTGKIESCRCIFSPGEPLPQAEASGV